MGNNSTGNKAGRAITTGLVEVYNLGHIKETLTSVETEFGDFAQNIEDVKKLLKDAVNEKEAIFGVGAGKMLEVMLTNLGAAKDFIDNFNNWLAYTEIQATEIAKMDSEQAAKFKMEQLAAANREAAYNRYDQKEKEAMLNGK